MHKILVLAIAAASSVAAFASNVNCTPAVRITMPADAYHPVLSPDGNTMLYSRTADHNGLCAMDLTTSRITVIDEAVGAGFNPVFSADGKSVAYRTASMVDGLLNRDVRTFSLTDHETEILQQPSRADVDMNAIANTDFATADWNRINVSLGGVVKRINPVADAHSYLWASLSPDHSQLLFTEPFMGVYVSDTDGANARLIAKKGDFPSWIAPDWIVMVVSHDDGYVILDSKIFAVNTITGEQIQLTPDNVIVGELSASENGRIIYTTIDGQVYMFNANFD